MKRKHKKQKTRERESTSPAMETVEYCLKTGKLTRSVDYVANDSDFEDNVVIDEINRDKVSTAALHLMFRRLRFNKEDMEVAKRKGIAFKKGRFTTQEDKVLTKNWRQFCDDFPVYNPHMVLGYFGYNSDMKDSDERHAAKDMIKKSQMYLRLAKDLPQRSLCQVYQRARKLFSGLNKSQNLTEEDRQRIIELGLKGVKSREIAHNFFADLKTVDEVIRRNINGSAKTFIKKMRWSEAEDHKFNEIIHEFITKNEISDPSKIPWADVAVLMGDRSDHQCREHFYTYSFFKVYDSNQQLKKWGFFDSQKLVYFLWTYSYENETDIDWDEIKEKFSDNPFNTVIKNWRQMKHRIRGYEDMTFPQILQRLYDKYIETRSNTEELEAFIRGDHL